MEATEWSCINYGGLHGYGNCPYYDQRWENRPDICWEGDEDFNPWNPPYYQHYGEPEHQPLEQEEPHQGHGGGKKILEEIVESFVNQSLTNFKNQEAAIKNLESQFQELSRKFMEEFHNPSQNDMVMSNEEQWEKIEECALIEENPVPQAFKKDEEDELPKEASEDTLELDFDNLVNEQQEQVVECEEVPIVDFFFGDKLM